MKPLALVVSVLVLAAAALFLALGNGDGDSGSKQVGQGGNSGKSKSGQSEAGQPQSGQSDGADGQSNSGGDSQGSGGTEGGSGQGGSDPVLSESSCPPDLSNCVVASGTVIYVEAVDPDGDGDAHFVTSSEEGVTFPGVTVFDVRTDLRPEPLPGIGDLVGGAGPVFTGSQGQKQIEVVEFHVAR
jgi:hypothetical protein